MEKKAIYCVGIVGFAVAFFVGQKLGFSQGKQVSFREAGLQATKSRTSINLSQSLGGVSSREDHYLGKRLVRGFFRDKESLEPEDFFEGAMRALEVENTMDRRAAVRELMSYVTNAEQVLAIQDSFAEITRTTGRDHHAIWQEFLRLSGEKLGGEVLDVFAEREKRFAGLMWNSFGGRSHCLR